MAVSGWPAQVEAAPATPAQSNSLCVQQHFLSNQVPTTGPCAGAATTNAATTNATTALPGSFQESIALGGLRSPTAVRFAPDGHVFVGEKSGLILVYDSLDAPAPKVFADLRTNVYDYWDRGLMGLALDPNFPTNPYVYVQYMYDAPPGGTAPYWGDNCPTPPGPLTDGCIATARISKLTAAPSGTSYVMTGSEQVLVQNGWCMQFPSHAADDLRFGPDGMLYATAGDGASWVYADYGQTTNPCGDPPGAAGTNLTVPTSEGGSLRAQSVRRPAGQPVMLNGALLRIDPNTGDGVPGNPFYASSDANAQRIYAYGLRNPFRFAVRPGVTDPDLWIGNVGWNTWEAIDRVAPGKGGTNFGWPCYEGPGPTATWSTLGATMCTSLYNTPGAVTAPYYAYNHSAKLASNDACPTGSSSISGLAFYTGSSYPAQYKNALFFVDYSRNCIWAMLAGTNGLPDPNKIVEFASGAAGPVDIEAGPNGDLFYVDLNGGTVRRIQYYSGNQPPIAVASANVTSGAMPLTVTFDATASHDPDGDAIASYAWDLNGDGLFGNSTAAKPTFTYTTAGRYFARVKVTDSAGLTAISGPLVIDAGVSPPVPTISSPASTLTWNVGDTINFSGSATDAQDGQLPASALTWVLLIHHCPTGLNACHIHIIQNISGVSSGSFAAPDHDYPSYLELRLIASDSLGLQATTSVLLYPNTTKVTLTSNTPGMPLSIGSVTAAAPFTITVISGTTTTISAQSPGAQLSWPYDFGGWSDGGAPSHTIVAQGATATYTATYTQRQASKTWYFAEGWTGSTFTEYLVVANPTPAGGAPAHVRVQYLRASGAPITVNYTVAPATRATFDVRSAIGASQSSGMVVTSDEPIVAERPQYGTMSSGTTTVASGTMTLGATALAQDFAFANVDTTTGHATYISVLNPNNAPLTVTTTYYPANSGTPVVTTNAVPANARGTYMPNRDHGLPAGVYSATVHLSAPGLVELANYMVDSVTHYAGTVDVMGRAPNGDGSVGATNWYFADGYTNTAYDERLIVANPCQPSAGCASTPAANVTITLYDSSGGKHPYSMNVPAGQQRALDVRQQFGNNLSNAAQVSANTPILADRLLSFVWSGTGPGNAETPGATQLAQNFGFADGWTGSNFADYLALENPDASQTAQVTMTFLTSTGQVLVKTMSVGPHSRSTAAINSLLPANTSYSLIVSSSIPIAADRTIYFRWGTTQTGGASVAGFQP